MGTGPPTPALPCLFIDTPLPLLLSDCTGPTCACAPEEEVVMDDVSFLSTWMPVVAGYCPTMPSVLSRSRRCKTQKRYKKGEG